MVSSIISANDTRDDDIPWKGVHFISSLLGRGTIYDKPIDVIKKNWDLHLGVPQVRQAAAHLAAETISVEFPQTKNGWYSHLRVESMRRSGITDRPSSRTNWKKTHRIYGPEPQKFVEMRRNRTISYVELRCLRWVTQSLEQYDFEKHIREKLHVATEFCDDLGVDVGSHVTHETIQYCNDIGGIWKHVAGLTEVVYALQGGVPPLNVDDRVRCVPDEDHRLFEVGVAGQIALDVPLISIEDWFSPTPFFGGRSYEPSLCFVSDNASGQIFYQTLPPHYGSSETAYRTLSRPFGGRSLKPDIWSTWRIKNRRIEILVECKYSLDDSYLNEGVGKILTYSAEYRPHQDVEQYCILAVRESRIATYECWDNRLFTARPSDLATIIGEITRPT